MKIMRVFIKPLGTSWIDFPVPETMTMPQIIPQVRLDGVFIHDSAVVPWDGMLFAAMLVVPDTVQPSMVFPAGTGKPN